MSFESVYYSAKPRFITIDDATISIRKFGEGFPILFIHGFPTNGYTWRKQVSLLEAKYTCYVVDLPGFGDSIWTNNTDFKSEAHANRLIKLFNVLGIDKYHVIAHASGGLIARLMAIKKPGKVQKMVLINTLIPNKRPLWIPLYCKMIYFPFATTMLRMGFKSRSNIRSSRGFKTAYYNQTLLDDPKNIGPYIKPAIQSKEKAWGILKYLAGIDWKKLDSLKNKHQEIECEVLLLWGVHDRAFPIVSARDMVAQFNNCKLIEIQNASMLPHEECDKEAATEIMKFFNGYESV